MANMQAWFTGPQLFVDFLNHVKCHPIWQSLFVYAEAIKAMTNEIKVWTIDRKQGQLPMYEEWQLA